MPTDPIDKFFSKSWQATEFSVPLKGEDRAALRIQLETASRMGRAFLPENAAARKVILDRIAMINEFVAIIESPLPSAS